MFTPAFYPRHPDPMAQAAAADAMSHARSAETSVDELRLEVERLLMINEALWSFIKKDHGYTDEELVDRIQEIDLQDGRLDGRVAKAPPMACARCGRTLPRGRPVCIFCGAPASKSPFIR